MGTSCECGVEEEDVVSAAMWRSAVLRKCKNLGLRSHVVFRPPWLLERIEAPTELTWDFETGLPRYHWCFIAGIVLARPGENVQWELGVETRFRDKELTRVRLKNIPPTSYGRLTYTPEDLVPGNTIVILYPRLVGQELVVKLTSHCCVIRCRLSAVLTYSDAICRNERKGMDPVCFTCSQSGSLSRCSRCHLAQYCSKECQKADWERGDHKALCKASRLIDALLGLPENPWECWYRFERDPNTEEPLLALEEEIFHPDDEVQMIST